MLSFSHDPMLHTEEIRNWLAGLAMQAFFSISDSPIERDEACIPGYEKHTDAAFKVADAIMKECGDSDITRYWFAGMALQGEIKSLHLAQESGQERRIALAALNIADAMMKKSMVPTIAEGEQTLEYASLRT